MLREVVSLASLLSLFLSLGPLGGPIGAEAATELWMSRFMPDILNKASSTLSVMTPGLSSDIPAHSILQLVFPANFDGDYKLPVSCVLSDYSKDGVHPTKRYKALGSRFTFHADYSKLSIPLPFGARFNQETGLALECSNIRLPTSTVFSYEFDFEIHDAKSLLRTISIPMAPADPVIIQTDLSAQFTAGVGQENSGIIFLANPLGVSLQERDQIAFTLPVPVTMSAPSLSCQFDGVNSSYYPEVLKANPVFSEEKDRLVGFNVHMPFEAVLDATEFFAMSCYGFTIPKDVPAGAKVQATFSTEQSKIPFAIGNFNLVLPSLNSVPTFGPKNGLVDREFDSMVHFMKIADAKEPAFTYNFRARVIPADIVKGDVFILSAVPGMTFENDQIQNQAGTDNELLADLIFGFSTQAGGTCKIIDGEQVTTEATYEVIPFTREGFPFSKAIKFIFPADVLVNKNYNLSISCDGMKPSAGAVTPTFSYLSVQSSEGVVKADSVLLVSPIALGFSPLAPISSFTKPSFVFKNVKGVSSLDIQFGSLGALFATGDHLSLLVPSGSVYGAVDCRCLSWTDNGNTAEKTCSQVYHVSEGITKNTLNVDMLSSSASFLPTDSFGMTCTGITFPKDNHIVEVSLISAHSLFHGSRVVSNAKIPATPAREWPTIGKSKHSLVFSNTVGARDASVVVELKPVGVELAVGSTVVFNVPAYTEVLTNETTTDADDVMELKCTVNDKPANVRATKFRGAASHASFVRIAELSYTTSAKIAAQDSFVLKCSDFFVPPKAASADALPLVIFNEKEEIIGNVGLDVTGSPVLPIQDMVKMSIQGVVGSLGALTLVMEDLSIDVYSGTTFRVVLPSDSVFSSAVKCSNPLRTFTAEFSPSDEKTKWLDINFVTGPPILSGIFFSVTCDRIPLSLDLLREPKVDVELRQANLDNSSFSFAQGRISLATGPSPVLIGDGKAALTLLQGLDVSNTFTGKSTRSAPAFQVYVDRLGVSIPQKTTLVFSVPAGITTFSKGSSVSSKNIFACRSSSATVTTALEFAEGTKDVLKAVLVTIVSTSNTGAGLEPSDNFSLYCSGFSTNRDVMSSKTVTLSAVYPSHPSTVFFATGDVAVSPVAPDTFGDRHAALSLRENVANGKPTHFTASFYSLPIDVNKGDILTIQVPAAWIFPTLHSMPEDQVVSGLDSRIHPVATSPESICWASLNDAYRLSYDSALHTEIIPPVPGAQTDYYQTIRLTFLADFPRLDLSMPNTLRVVCGDVLPPAVVVSYRRTYHANLASSTGFELLTSPGMTVRDTTYLPVVPASPMYVFSLDRRTRRPYTDMESLTLLTSMAHYLSIPVASIGIFGQTVVSKKKKLADNEVELFSDLAKSKSKPTITFSFGFLNTDRVELDEAAARMNHLYHTSFDYFKTFSRMDIETKLVEVTKSSRVIPKTCFNREKDVNETNVDCGGDCPTCSSGKPCETSVTCSSGYCTKMSFMDYDTETMENVEVTRRTCVDVGNPSRLYTKPFY